MALQGDGETVGGQLGRAEVRVAQGQLLHVCQEVEVQGLTLGVVLHADRAEVRLAEVGARDTNLLEAARLGLQEQRVELAQVALLPLRREEEGALHRLEERADDGMIRDVAGEAQAVARVGPVHVDGIVRLLAVEPEHPLLDLVRRAVHDDARDRMQAKLALELDHGGIPENPVAVRVGLHQAGHERGPRLLEDESLTLQRVRLGQHVLLKVLGGHGDRAPLTRRKLPLESQRGAQVPGAEHDALGRLEHAAPLDDEAVQEGPGLRERQITGALQAARVYRDDPEDPVHELRRGHLALTFLQVDLLDRGHLQEARLAPLVQGAFLRHELDLQLQGLRGEVTGRARVNLQRALPPLRPILNEIAAVGRQRDRGAVPVVLDLGVEAGPCPSARPHVLRHGLKVAAKLLRSHGLGQQHLSGGRLDPREQVEYIAVPLRVRIRDEKH